MTLELAAVDQFLIVERRQNAFLLMGLIVPASYRVREWYRFARVEKPPE